jgi:hypothetical protein
LPRIRSLVSIDSRPNDQFSVAAVSEIVDDRNRLSAKVTVAAGDRPALLALSRPFFNGYRATIAGRELSVSSYRGLIPLVDIPPGSSGRLVIAFRPRWLVLGGAIAAASLAAFVASTAFAFSRCLRR